MKIAKHSFRIPSDSNFLSNKDISDRVFVWILLRGVTDGDEVYIEKKPRGGSKELNINYRTFCRRFQKIIDSDYLEEYEDKYKVNFEVTKYKRWVYRDTLEVLLDTGIDDIIKVYIYLGTLYSTYGDNAYFSLSEIEKNIGCSSIGRTHTNNKIKNILKKLRELFLIRYTENAKYCKYNKRYKIERMRKSPIIVEEVVI